MRKHIVFDCDGTLVDTSQFKFSLFPGIQELLSALAAENSLYVWTARDRLSTLRIMKELGIMAYFENICTIDDAIAKPHVSGLIELVGGVDKSLVCMIGDTSNDIVGAKNYGIKSIGAGWNKNAMPEVLTEAGVSFLADSPEQCLDWIKKNL